MRMKTCYKFLKQNFSGFTNEVAAQVFLWNVEFDPNPRICPVYGWKILGDRTCTASSEVKIWCCSVASKSSPAIFQSMAEGFTRSLTYFFVNLLSIATQAGAESLIEKLFFNTLIWGSTSLWLVDPPVKGWISIDRSLVAALPSTIPWPVLKSSTNGSAIPKPCVTQILCYPSLRAAAWNSYNCGMTRFEGLISGRLSAPGM